MPFIVLKLASVKATITIYERSVPMKTIIFEVSFVMRLLLFTSPYELPNTRSLTVFPLSDVHVTIRPCHLADPIWAIVIIIPDINTAIAKYIFTETTFFV